MVHNIKSDELNNEYFEWMYHLVSNNDGQKNKISYRKLLYALHSSTFIPMVEMDDNRRIDGIDFRYRFGYESGYPDLYIEKYLNIRDCSILEMMIALSFKVEEEITDNHLYGNRTGQWFWSMIQSLGLNTMDDTKFNIKKYTKIIDVFLSRQYKPNGDGGLFTLDNPRRDMREVDIWCQFMWYLNEKIKEE